MQHRLIDWLRQTPLLTLGSAVCALAALMRIALREAPDAFITIISSGDVTGLQAGNQPHW